MSDVMELLKHLVEDPPVLVDWLKDHDYDTTHLEWAMAITMTNDIPRAEMEHWGIARLPFNWLDLAHSSLEWDGSTWRFYGIPMDTERSYCLGMGMGNATYEQRHAMDWLVRLKRGQAKSVQLPTTHIAAACTVEEVLALTKGFFPHFSWDREKLARTYEKYGDEEWAKKLRATR